MAIPINLVNSSVQMKIMKTVCEDFQNNMAEEGIELALKAAVDTD